MATALMRLPRCWPVKIEANAAHWHRDGTHHGPKSNPRLIALSLVRLEVHRPSEGWRVWLYVRGGYACHLDVIIDRRG